jgi:hypothetical protein
MHNTTTTIIRVFLYFLNQLRSLTKYFAKDGVSVFQYFGGNNAAVLCYQELTRYIETLNPYRYQLASLSIIQPTHMFIRNPTESQLK